MLISKVFQCLKYSKPNPNEPYTNKYQKHVACSYGYKLVRIDDKFSKLLKSYLGKDAVYKFISSMTEKNKCYSNVMKKDFSKEFMITKKENEVFENSTKCWICDNAYIENDVKVIDHCHIS